MQRARRQARHDLVRPDDPHDLARFVSAQQGIYEIALSELRRGRKQSHWMWFIFPQVAGLGVSSTSRRYAIGSLAEAEAYLNHEVLGTRLLECTEAVLGIEGRSVHQIFGSPDDMKLRSSVTLFGCVSPRGSAFERLLVKYFGGTPDEVTLSLLGLPAGSSGLP